jgi:hypothetical protein
VLTERQEVQDGGLSIQWRNLVNGGHNWSTGLGMVDNRGAPVGIENKCLAIASNQLRKEMKKQMMSFLALAIRLSSKGREVKNWKIQK